MDLAARVDVRRSGRIHARLSCETACESSTSCAKTHSLRGRCEITKGEPGNPHAPAEIRKNFDQLATPRVGGAVHDVFTTHASQMEAVPDLANFCSRR